MKRVITINESRLARFSAFAGAVLASSAVNSQIVYTNVDPDIIIDTASGQYNLDFNVDAMIDVTLNVMNVMEFTSISTSTSAVYAGSLAVVTPGIGAGVVAILGSSSSSYVTAMNNGDLIGTAAVFGGSSMAALAVDITITSSFSSYQISNGAFLGVTDKFLGVKFLIGTNTHYGWARLDVSANADTIRLKDYAYNVAADSPILAGQTLGLDAISVENKVTIKTTLDNATINVTPDLIGGRVVMFNIAGQEIKVVQITDVNTEILYEGVETGIYTITAQFDGGMVNKKVYIK
jgi:hypothetical protein